MEGLSVQQLEFVTIYTRNLEEARRFWVTVLGCKILRETPNEFLQIEIAGVPICIDLAEKSAPPQANNIGVSVSNLEQTVAALRRKGLEVHPGFNAASRERWAAVKDPDGNELIFLTHEESTHRPSKTSRHSQSSA